jgi:tetratricopeptide (TPR) repeat protein
MDSSADPRDTSLVASLLVRSIRRRLGGSLEDAALYLGMSEKTLRRWDRGTSGASPEHLALLAKEAGYPPALVQGVVRLLGLLRLAEADAEDGGPRDNRVVAAAASGAGEAHLLLSPEPAPELWECEDWPPAVNRAEALWWRFTSRGRAQQTRLVRESSVFHARSFCERLCEESAAAAPGSPAAALELARLAVTIARESRGTEHQREASEATARVYLANALRVANDLAGSDSELGRARQLLATCEASLSNTVRSRLLDLESSLHRAQRRFPEALACLEKALACGTAETGGKILLQRAAVYQQMEDHEKALATLREAAPHVEAYGTLHNLFALRFNTAANLAYLGDARTAEGLLPEIQALTEQLNKAVDRLRFRWLEAMVDAGLGRTESAIARMDRVCEEFLRTDPPLPYDAALAGLDLARFWLKEGNTGAVQRLAVPLGRIFRAQGIQREAAASLRLFCEAARREAATVDLVEKVEAEVRRAGRGAAASARD